MTGDRLRDNVSSSEHAFKFHVDTYFSLDLNFHVSPIVKSNSASLMLTMYKASRVSTVRPPRR